MRCRDAWVELKNCFPFVERKQLHVFQQCMVARVSLQATYAILSRSYGND